MLYPRASLIRDVRGLNGFWEFAKDKENVGIKERWFDKPPATRPIAVPANYNEQTADDDLWEYFGAVWYFRRFVCPPTWSQRRIFLRVGAANYSAKVWLDGRPLMQNEGGALPFEADITRRVKPGAECFLAVRVDSTLSHKTIPPTLPWKQTGRPFEYFFDFLNMSGIHRPVRLYTTGRSYVKDVAVRPSISGKTGRLAVDVEVEGPHDAVRLTLLDKNGRGVVSAERSGRPVSLDKSGRVIVSAERSGRPVSLNKSGRVIVSAERSAGPFNLSIPNCRFWSTESPYLYTLRVDVLRGGGIVDQYPLPVGVRTVKVQGNRFLLNGKPVYFKGASRHEDFPVLGRGMNEAVLVKDFSLMKWMNINSYRTSHYPHSEEEMNLADRMGIMVIDEAPCVGQNDWVHKVFVKGLMDEETQRTHLEMIRRMYERDKNHPCVVMWSIADEPASNEAAWVKYAKPLFAFLKKADPMRPVSFATTAHDFDEKSGQLCDLILFNRYYGWYQRTGQLDGIEGPLSEELDGWYRKYKKPVILEEYGADTIEGFHHQPPIIFSEEYQLELVKRTCKVLDSKPYVIGEHIWVLFDFATKQDLRRVNGNRKGIFNRVRQPKMSAHWLKERWAEK